MEKGRIEHRDVRDIGQQSACHLDAQYRRRVVQRGQRRQLLKLADHRVIQQRRLVKLRAAVDHPVSDRHQPAGLQVNSVLGQHLECAMQRLGVIGNRG
ncbi:Uncharacterised protein [Mycobacterium tuberculosis]|uniref:Uncharacterized protein n=1 Tax=Mycobacterium tuberculosis TaxID=1773 RepID=A0A655D4Y0_MYCTX|nr:Uncharacterised protein [Mycobacterium tuberculosis]CNW89673.1 Uncharacterised protein [Mycobacterium tuberculosis]